MRTSERQVQAIAREVADKAAENEYAVKRMEGLDNGRWVTCDWVMSSSTYSIKMNAAIITWRSYGGDAPLLNLGNEQ